MADTGAGKKWEAEFRKTWANCFPNTFLYRIPDAMTGFKETSQNPCDFLCFPKNELFMVECKTHKGASIPFTAIPQYERLLEYKGYKGVIPGILIWFSEKDLVIWVDINEAEKMVKNGEKSIGIRMLKGKLYNILVLPIEMKRVYPKVDYTYLVNYYKEANND